MRSGEERRGKIFVYILWPASLVTVAWLVSSSGAGGGVVVVLEVPVVASQPTAGGI